MDEKQYCDFQFQSPVIYSESKDVLFSFPENLGKQKYTMLWILPRALGTLPHNKTGLESPLNGAFSVRFSHLLNLCSFPA